MISKASSLIWQVNTHLSGRPFTMKSSNDDPHPALSAIAWPRARASSTLVGVAVMFAAAEHAEMPNDAKKQIAAKLTSRFLGINRTIWGPRDYSWKEQCPSN